MPSAYTLLVFQFIDITTYKIVFCDRNQCFVNVFQGMQMPFAYFARVKFLMGYFKYLSDSKFFSGAEMCCKRYFCRVIHQLRFYSFLQINILYCRRQQQVLVYTHA